eukprot:GEMP01055553.1.p1 GENE.GEMP01055553.1~~GEMP01055553.1.p1  ORF type:complete len:214 (+),score=58.24 GEMP01055553.1:89-730(+)
MSRKNNKGTRRNNHKAMLEREKEAKMKKQRKQKKAELVKTDLEKLQATPTRVPKDGTATALDDAMDDVKPQSEATALGASSGKDVTASDESKAMDESMDDSKAKAMDDAKIMGDAQTNSTRRMAPVIIKKSRKMFRRDLGRCVIKTSLKKQTVSWRRDHDIVMADAKPKLTHNADLFEPKHIKMIRKRVEKRLRKNIVHVRRGLKKKETDAAM